MNRWTLLIVLLLLTGCDVAAVTAAFTAKSGSSDDDPLPTPLPGFPTPIFKAWIASLPDAAAADAARTDLVASGGNPPVSLWTEIGNALATEIFDPSADPAAFNAILLQVSSTQNFQIDSVEILDANGAVLEHATGTTWSNQVNLPDEILGPPNGVSAVTTAAGTERAFIFSLYTGPIDRFRISTKGETLPPQPGDVTSVGGFTSTGDEVPGGLAIDANGLIHLTLTVDDTIRLVRLNLDGSFADDVELSTDAAVAGSHSVALAPGGLIYTAASVSGGVVQVRQFGTNLAVGPIRGFSSSFNGDRVERNSIAIDGSGSVVVVGGMSSLLSGRNHWRVKLPSNISGTVVWESPTSLDSSQNTYWYGVTTGPDDEVFMTGNLNTTLLGGTDQVYSSRFNAAGVAQWDDEYVEGDQPSDVGHAIALDPAGNLYVGGSVGTDGDMLDGILLRYTAGGNLSADFDATGVAGENDEILDIAVDSDGAIYAVGYETVANQGENMWIRKFVYDTIFNEFNTVWTRTHHGGFGDDRAVSVAISGTSLVVAGYETNSTGQTKLVLRVYEK